MLAPLHNPANLEGIRAAKQAFPDIPHVAVFDTAFHQTLAPAAYTYAIDREFAEAHRVRRYGFHGTSHKFVSEAAANFVGRDLTELRQIVFHLGNGASATAIRGRRSVDTSMGLTPLEGLVMGTRSGDLDPAVLIHLARRAGQSIDDLDAPRLRGRPRAARRRRRHLVHRRGGRELGRGTCRGSRDARLRGRADRPRAERCPRPRHPRHFNGFLARDDSRRADERRARDRATDAPRDAGVRRFRRGSRHHYAGLKARWRAADSRPRPTAILEAP